LIALVVEILGLGRYDLEVIIAAADIAVGEDPQGILGRINRLVLLPGLA
jgi:hypothetical protein